MSRAMMRGFLMLASGVFLAASALSGAEPAIGARRLTTMQRMEPAHLKAAHEDVARLAATRRDIAARPGRRDLRAIFHAHAEDSSHTGGTRPEMLADAKTAGINAIFLSDHFRPPRDFITDSWHGARDGVLFVPGSEIRGFLILPTRSIMARMDDPVDAFIDAVRADDGLIFLSHVEERRDHPTDRLDGLEVVNRHYEAIADKAGLLGLVLKMTDPDAIAALNQGVADFPDELFASQQSYPSVYLDKWDADTATHRLTGVAANDCHHNTVLVVKMVDADTVLVGTNVDRDDQMRKVPAALRPGIRQLTKNHKAGDVLGRVDLDPYRVSFRNACTHILAADATEPTLRAAVRGGHAYVSHDWMGDATGFRFEGFVGAKPDPALIQGDETRWNSDDDEPLTLRAEVPIAGHLRLIAGGKVVATSDGDRLEHTVTKPGAYRVECWLDIDNERRPWIYSNPIYVRGSR